MKGKHAQKNFGAVGAMAPTPLSLKTPGGGGGVAYKDRAWPPPPPVAGLLGGAASCCIADSREKLGDQTLGKARHGSHSR